MSGAEYKLEQAIEWLAADDDEMRTEVCLSLPESDWIRLIEVERQGSSLVLKVMQGIFENEARELVCDLNDLRAVRRRPVSKLEGFLSDGTESSDRDDLIPF